MKHSKPRKGSPVACPVKESATYARAIPPANRPSARTLVRGSTSWLLLGISPLPQPPSANRHRSQAPRGNTFTTTIDEIARMPSRNSSITVEVVEATVAERAYRERVVEASVVECVHRRQVCAAPVAR
ncbi:uncharacterized protein LOC119180915 isoform X3 [Rhipicephalus microplus]|uniref:uncharacterized protein LOC119180915 isoform X3 n=1 Tax=Rhipicephalus microplus TaxID=6941 RepID=UPI003F6CDFD1